MPAAATKQPGSKVTGVVAPRRPGTTPGVCAEAGGGKASEGEARPLGRPLRSLGIPRGQESAWGL